MVARFLMTKELFCPKVEGGCDSSQIHFHDEEDWREEEDQKTLQNFWQKYHNDQDSNQYVDDVWNFIRQNGPKVATMFAAQQPQSLTFLEQVIDSETRFFLESLQNEEESKELESSYAMQCAWLATLMDMQACNMNMEKLWFEIFFEYYVEFDDEDSGDDEDNEDDQEDDSEEDEEDQGEADEAGSDADTEILDAGDEKGEDQTE